MSVKTRVHATLTAAVIGLGLIAAPAAQAAYKDGTVRFGVPPWPGVTVKTEVAARLLQAMGYQTEQKQLGYPVIINGLRSHDLEVYLAGWYPQEKELIEPLAQKGEIEKIAANLPKVLTGLAVPSYIAEAGVTSVADLAAHADELGGKIYGIEAGSGWNTAMQKAIDSDRDGLGAFELVESSSSGMLAQVSRAVNRKEWVAWLAWMPHWMNVTLDIHYLTDTDDSEIAGLDGTVYTVVPGDLAQRDPQLARFLRQFVLDPRVQSQWVLDYSKNKRKEADIAAEWIPQNMETVATWLDGVRARNGRPAIEAVRAAFTD